MFLLLVLGLGLAVALTLGYSLLRASPWSPHDGGALAWARLHGFATALIAAVGVPAAALFLQSLQSDHGPAEFSLFVTPGAEALELDATALHPGQGLLVAVSPGLWLLAIHAIAQRTWPRATGVVRTARLQAQRATHLLPAVLTTVAGGVCVAALAAITLAWTAPGTAPLHLSYATGGSTLESFSPGVRPGAEFAPWLLLALGTLAASTAVVVFLVSRRPALTGITADEDEALRRITVHRVLRTTAAGTLIILVVAVAGWADGTLQAATREAYGSLDAMAAAYAEGLTLDGDGGAHLDLASPPRPDLPPGFDVLRAGLPFVALLGVIILLSWRPSRVKARVDA